MVFKRALLRWHSLFLISGLGLFLEMAVIRWISAELRLFSYFKNLPLLAAFLGLAIGFALVGRGRDYWPEFAPLLGIFVALVLIAGRVISPGALAYPSSGDELLWHSTDFSFWLALAQFFGVLLIFFLLTMLLFIPLGQATGEEMARHDPVPAYIVNLLASLAGIWAFALLSYLQTPPPVWFGLAILGIGSYLVTKRMLSRLTLTIFALTLVGLVILDRDIVWSPYHRLYVAESFYPRENEQKPVKAGYVMTVQHVFYQHALDLSQAFLTQLQGESPDLEQLAFSYNLPYRVGPEGAKVLIVGAGMGNDVAAALRNGASHVDAVEIDPAILELGRELHPESPYDDPRVNFIVEDARSFFEKSTERYDVIAFGLLDSHTLLSSLSSVRLDSFVYTLDSFEQVREHLTEGGVVSVTFHVGESWIKERLGRMLVEVFGPEKVFLHQPAPGIVTFVAGSVSPDRLAENHLAGWKPDPAAEDLPLTTDDWPYLYLRARRVPAAYWQALLLIGLACLALIARSFPEALRPNWHFYLLGAAFLLIEFKSVTELALLFGTTWLVNVLAISGVLMMALGANLIVLRRPRLDLRLVYTLLFLSLGLNYFMPMDLLIGFSPTVRAIGSMILLSLPLFFAGLIFGESLRRARQTARPLASNLSGSVAGGVLEYGSLLWGIKSLCVIAAVVYLGALFAHLIQRE